MEIQASVAGGKWVGIRDEIVLVKTFYMSYWKNDSLSILVSMVIARLEEMS